MGNERFFDVRGLISFARKGGKKMFFRRGNEQNREFPLCVGGRRAAMDLLAEKLKWWFRALLEVMMMN